MAEEEGEEVAEVPTEDAEAGEEPYKRYSINRVLIKPGKSLTVSTDVNIPNRLPVLPKEPKAYTPMPYVFRVSSASTPTKVVNLLARSPPFHVLLDHTIAVVWLLFATGEYDCPLDSQAALKAPSLTSKLVLYCQKRLSSIGELNKVLLVWIPGHSSMDGNEKADSPAKESAARVSIRPVPTIGIAISFAKQTLNTWTARRALDFWHNLPGLVHSKALIHPSKNVSKQILDYSRHDLRYLTALLTGNCYLNHHMLKLGLSEDPTCRLRLEDDETADHIVVPGPPRLESGINQLQWALAFLKTIQGRTGDYSKDIGLCIEALENILVTQYSDLNTEIGPATRLDETIHYGGGALGSNTMVTREIPFSLNYSQLIMKSPPNVYISGSAQPMSMTSLECEQALEDLKKAAGVDSIENLDSVSREKAINVLRMWKSDQVEKIRGELRRLRSIEDKMKDIDSNFPGYVEDDPDALISTD